MNFKSLLFIPILAIPLSSFAAIQTEYFDNFQSEISADWENLSQPNQVWAQSEDNYLGKYLHISGTSSAASVLSMTGNFEAGRVRFESSIGSSQSEYFNDNYLIDNQGWVTSEHSILGGADQGFTFSYRGYSTTGFMRVDNFRYIANSIDTDNDFMPDTWEESQGFDSADSEDGTLDFDSDGITNELEYWLNTNPKLADTDADGISDLIEVQYNLDPNLGSDSADDLDLDGLTNLEEAGYGSKLDNADSDNDGLSDFVEINTHTTDPSSNDTDGDGYKDGYEVAKSSDPLDKNDFPGEIFKFSEGFEQALQAEWSDVASKNKWEIQSIDTISNSVGASGLVAKVFSSGQTAEIELSLPSAQGKLEFRYYFPAGADSSGSARVTVNNSNYNTYLSSSTSPQWKTDVISLNQGNNVLRFSYTSPTNWNEGEAIYIDQIRFLALVNDSDSDLMDDEWETLNNLNPNTSNDHDDDLDNDGLPNRDEFWASTDPYDSDSDDDGLPDGWEYLYKLDPNDDTDASSDDDLDELSAIEEFNSGSSPILSDTDSDGITDIDEVNLHLTNPALADSDSDGLSDLVEINDHETNPILADSDLDGVFDGIEISLGTNANSADDYPVAKTYLRENFETTMPAGWINSADNTSDWDLSTSSAILGKQSLKTDSVQTDGISTIKWNGYFKSGKLTFSFKLINSYFKIYLNGIKTFAYSAYSESNGKNRTITIPEGTLSIEFEVRGNSANSSYPNFAAIDNIVYFQDTEDTDNDKMVDAWEIEKFGSLSQYYHQDFDDDKLDNVYEFYANSDPTSIDSDSDGMDDFWEYTYGLDLVNSSDKDTDLDSDGLINLDEYTNNSYPNRADSDSDNLTDYLEVKVYGTNPMDRDTDNDRLYDYAEILSYLTNPLAIDTDGDTVSDYDEVSLNTDPKDIFSFPNIITNRFFSFEDGVPSDWSYSGDFALSTRNVLDGDYSLELMQDRYSASLSYDGYFSAGTFSVYAASYIGNRINLSSKSDNDSHLIDEEGARFISVQVKEGINRIDIRLYNNDNLDLTPTIDYAVYTPLDSDGDQIPDYWENMNGLNPFINSDAGLDPDEDNLTNSQEFAYSTDINNPDTDLDGIPDGWEVAHGLMAISHDSGIDIDNDGLTNLEEYNADTHPLVSDTDGDGTDDEWEIINMLAPTIYDSHQDADQDGLTNLQEFTVNTDPNSSDTDNDGMNDSWEVRYGLNPLDDDSSEDPDLDGLSNLEEFKKQTSPIDFNELADNNEGGPIGPLLILLIAVGILQRRRQLS